MLLKNALVYINTSKSFQKVDISIRGGKITGIGCFEANDGEVYDLDGYAVVPGLVDVHTHGRAGYDFLTAPADKLSYIAADYASHGVTAVMPTLASAPLEDMIAATDRINKFSNNVGEAHFCGVHLEGRYLSPAYRGAHAESLLADLDAHELEHEVFRMCKHLHISAAFERDTEGCFAKKAIDLGATLALAHTSATYEEAMRAEDRGVTAYTHLYNAMPTMHHRDGGAVCAALTGKSFAELICDGIHVSPQMIRLAYGMLTDKRAVVVSDSMEGTGCPDGEYMLAGSRVLLKDGKAYTDYGAIAGSTLTLDEAVRNLMGFCSIPLTEAILSATENPAKEVGIFSECGEIAVGKSADILVISDTDSLNIKKVMIDGKFI